MFGREKRLERRLEESGARAQARVLTCHQGATTFTGSDAFPSDVHVTCRLKLEVQAATEPSFEAKASGQFKPNAMPSVGDMVEVLYDPGDHDKLVVSAASRTQGRVDVQIVQRPSGDTPHQMPTITINGETVQAGSSGAAPARAGVDPAKELAELAQLRDRGVLTDAEFETQKAKLLDRL